MTGRLATISRTTSESSITVTVNLDGEGTTEISTGVGFYDHMLTTLGKHSLIDLTVQAQGDIHIDGHHTIEDTAISLGQAIREALGDKKGIRRFGTASVPLDEALATCTVDVAGRPYTVCVGEPDFMSWAQISGTGAAYAGSMTRHVVESLAYNAGLCVHLELVRGRDPHHIVEAQYKALARALRVAVEHDPRETGIPSTKGAL